MSDNRPYNQELIIPLLEQRIFPLRIGREIAPIVKDECIVNCEEANVTCRTVWTIAVDENPKVIPRLHLELEDFTWHLLRATVKGEHNLHCLECGISRQLHDCRR